KPTCIPSESSRLRRCSAPRRMSCSRYAARPCPWRKRRQRVLEDARERALVLEDARKRALAAEPAVVEVLLLLRRRYAAHDRVGMRKAAEPANDVAVFLGVFQVLALRLGIELHAALLVDQLLGVHERQEEEVAQLVRHVLIVAALERAVRDLPRQRIRRIGAR